MVGQEFQVPCRNTLLVGGNCCTELGSLLLKSREVCGVFRSAIRVEFSELVADQPSVFDRVTRIGPQVWIGLAFLFREGEVIDVVGLREHQRPDLNYFSALFLVGLRHINCWILELETVDQDQIRVAEQLGNLRGWLESVAIRALGNDSLDSGAVPRN